ncbi:MAG: outer membrane beta-barrel protein [Ignavibacteriales bacterium]|nr:MAG: outer membrane beta-barrel protein [Ignavibacteriales bacterium]
MKTLAILLFPFLLFAQQNYTDNLVLVNGKSFPCMVTSISDEKVEIIYMNYVPEKTILKAVSLITVDKLGEIYSAEKGFSYKTDYLNDFFEKRIDEFNKQKEIAAELERISTENKVVNDKSEIGNVVYRGVQGTEYIVKGDESKNRWSFGVLYVPYFTDRLYNVVISSSNPPSFSTYYITENEINLEGQLAYNFQPDFSVSLDFSYSDTQSEIRSEDHSRGMYNNFDEGEITKSGLSVFDFSIGLKYYLHNRIPGKVSAYVLAGFGKQFAFAEETSEVLFSTYPNTLVFENNVEEYLEDLNSPWHFNLGFGAEYFFNQSLSLVSNIRFLYSATTAKYDSRSTYIGQETTYSSSREYKTSYVNTRFGLGLNFYF